MKLEELNIYSASMELADNIWNILKDSEYFPKDTVGKQLIRAVDSIAANISEGYGRFHYKDRTNFLYFSRGSLFETKTWLTKAHQRKLIDNESYKTLLENVDELGVKLNNFINTTRSKKINSDPNSYTPNYPQLRERSEQITMNYHELL